MPKDINFIIHSPKLESVIMVEKTIEKYSSDYTIYQLWKKLPKKMMYQTYKLILDYLESSKKIIIDKDNTVIWIFDKKNIKKILSTGVKLR
jgi:transposase